MATIPKATTTVQDTAGVPAGGLDVCCVFSPCAQSADMKARFFGSPQDVYAQHGYCEGVEYTALHVDRTGKGVLFVGLPITTPGVLSKFNNEGNTGTALLTVTGSPLAGHSGKIAVDRGGVVGVDQIVLALSLDGGRKWQKLRLGTGNSISIPYMNLTITVLPGTLVTDDTVLTWHGSAPQTDDTSINTARQNLAQQQKAFRSILRCGDLADHVVAQGFTDMLNTYETANERFVFGRASIADRLPLAAPSYLKHVTSGVSQTFLASAHTITRASGSFITDGFAVGDLVYSTGTASNNGLLGKLTAVTATVLTFASGLVNETAAACILTGRTSLVFAASGNTVTRNAGSFIADGLAVGMSVTFAGTVSNNATKTITAVTATVLTFASGIVDETIGLGVATVTRALLKAAWMALADAEFSAVDDQPRIDLSSGRARVLSPFSGWYFRRPAAWAASIREYQHDLHIPTWRKSDGPTGWDLFDEEGNVSEEWDDRIDGGAASAARFTSFRTWANGPVGAYITQSLTRAKEGSILQQTHNVAVINLIQTITQLNTENAAIGTSLLLNEDGTATTDSLATISDQVNAALALGVLADVQGEGPRASSAQYVPNPNTVMNVPEPRLVGVVKSNLRGAVHDVDTKVRVLSGGQQ
jgi:hypothetical protein